MKVLHVYKDFDPPVHGGIERHMALMCRYQREWGEVSALTCSGSLRTRRVTRDGTEVMEAGEWGRVQGAPASPSYPWRMRRANADVVVLHVPHPTGELGYLLSRPRGALVVRYHSDVVRQANAMRLYKPVLMHFLRRADIILPTSQRYVDMSPVLQSFTDRCDVVPLGIEVERFSAPAPEKVKSVRERYGERFVFFCGRHRYYKGLKYLVEAAAQIDVPVVIAGDGPERNELEQMASRSTGNIVFPGSLEQDDLIAHLHAATVVAFPSVERSEAFGIGILEAHACGTPVVATQLGTGVEFANLDGETGLNVSPRDATALAKGLNRLLGDPELAATMGARGKARVAAEFDVRNIARMEWDLYRKAWECRTTGT